MPTDILSSIEDAQARLEGVAWRTPMLRSEDLSQHLGIPVTLKAENLQHTGSFKLRGAANAIAKLPPERLERGIVAASAGNHARAVARAAANAGVSVTVCMPTCAPLAKLDPVRALGADVRLVEDTYEDAQEAAQALAEDENRPLIHPFADPDVIAGQGTVGLEIASDAPDTKLIVVPMGGGGLVSGVAIAAKDRLAGVRVVAVQAAARSGRTIADGIAVKQPSELTLSLVEKYVDEVVAVSDDEIAQAMVHLIERSKLVVEGAGAAGAAAMLCGRVEPPASGSACIVLSGGNVDASLLAECIRLGETAAGRRAVLKTVVPDRPGALDAVLRVVADHGANIVDVAHLREGVDLHVRETLVRLVIQTTGREHALAIADAIRADGFAVDIEH
jgi:threonine dehydratase